MATCLNRVLFLVFFLHVASKITASSQGTGILVDEPSVLLTQNVDGPWVTALTWRTRWYHTANWNEYPSRSDLQVISYSYCSADTRTDWFRTNFIKIENINKLFFEVSFTMRNCTGVSSLQPCKNSFDLYEFQTDKPADGNPGNPHETPGNFQFVQTISGTTLDLTTINTVTVTINNLNKAGIYLTLKTAGGCYSVKAIKVMYQACPELVQSLVHYNLTMTSDQSVDVTGVCVMNARPVDDNIVFVVKCPSNGQWNISQDYRCQCLSGYENKQNTACEECPVGYYKGIIGNLPCLKCPENSNSSSTGQTNCSCDEGLYRALWESVDKKCSGLPSSPRKLNVLNISSYNTSLQWSAPADNGNRTDVYYIVECKKCTNPNDTSPCDESCQVQFFPSNNVTDSSVNVHRLSPYTRYIFTVTAMNGVSGESNKGDWNSVNLTVVSPDTSPSTPTKLTATTISESVVSLSWTLQQANTVLSGYEIVYYPQDELSDAKTISLMTTNTTIKEYLLKGLKPGTTYVIKVRAKGRSGFGHFSKEVKIVTPGGKKGDNGFFSNLEAVIPIGVFVFLLVAIITVLIVLMFRRKKRRQDAENGLVSADFLNALGLQPRNANFMDPRDNYEEALRIFTREIDIDTLKLEKIIGGGEFGDVYKGFLEVTETNMLIPVAVKVLKPTCGRREKEDFLSEASLMGQFEDPNVVHLEGVVSKGRRVMIVTEFMANGSLDNFLKQNDGTLSVLQLLGMARGVASGMKYLSELNFIHRDLAARNILVNEILACKVADFGMSRELEDQEEGQQSEYETRGGKIPVRWTAPEAIENRRFSTFSDVWSYGIMVWELVSYGQRPYWDWGNFEVIERLKSGYRLPPPMGCPVAVHEIMLNCWNAERESRPTFADLVSQLDVLIRSPDRLNEIQTSRSNLSNIQRSASASNDVSSPTSNTVYDWLESLRMSQYSENFTRAGYTDMNQVTTLQETDLEEIGIRLIGHRNKLIKSLSAMRTSEVLDKEQDDIQTWLTSIKMSRYIDNFTNAGFTSVQRVSLMCDGDLKNIGVQLIGHRNKILKSISTVKTQRQDSLKI